MTIEDLGSIGELVAAIATIATLFYLAVQIRQNTRTVEAAAFQSGVDGINHLNNLLAHDESMARVLRLGNEGLKPNGRRKSAIRIHMSLRISQL